MPHGQEPKHSSTIGRLVKSASPLAMAIAAAGTLSLTLPETAQAQQQAAPALEEIVVTARYREESIQTTPIAITAFTGEDLDVRSLTTVQDVGLVIPNAFFRENVGNFGPTPTVGLRGLIQQDFSYAFEPKVALYIDDVYRGTLTGADMDLIDLERVEVLRGPQGTLFGKNSLGGAIRLISRKPEGDNSGRVEATYGRFDRLDLKAVGDFSLVEDKVFTRIVGISQKRDGHGTFLDFTCDMIRKGTPELAGIGDGLAADGTTGAPDGQPDMVEPGSPADNDFSLPAARDVTQGDGCALGTLGGTQTDGGRVILRMLPSDRLEVNLTAEYIRKNDDPNPQTLLTQHQGGPFDTPYDLEVLNATYGVRYTADDRFVTGDPYTNYSTYADPLEGQTYPTNAVTEDWGMSGTIDYDVTDRIQATFITAYRTYWSEWSSDTDLTPFPIQHTHYVQEHEQWQLEGRLTGTLMDSALEWTLGGFYYDANQRAYNTTEFGGFDYTGFLVNFVANDLYTTNNKSGFLHLAYNVTDRLSVSGGIRYTDEKKTNIFDHQPGLVVTDPATFQGSRWDWKASVDFQATEDTFLYAQAASGFVSAGFNPRIFTVGQLAPIPEEEVITYEVGAKTEFFDNRLRANMAAFYSDYDPRIVSVFGAVNQCDAPNDPDPEPYFLQGGNCPEGTFFAGSGGLPWFFYTNSPGNIQGVELELTATPIDGLNINYSLGYNEYNNDEDDPNSPNFRHPSALLQPKWNMSGGIQYSIPFMGSSRIVPRLDWFYQSHRTNGAATQENTCPEECIPGYHIFNGRITYENLASNWSLSFAVTNLFDKFYWQQLDAAVSNTGGVPDARTGVPSRPREWSITATKRF